MAHPTFPAGRSGARPYGIDDLLAAGAPEPLFQAQVSFFRSGQSKKLHLSDNCSTRRSGVYHVNTTRVPLVDVRLSGLCQRCCAEPRHSTISAVLGAAELYVNAQRTLREAAATAASDYTWLTLADLNNLRAATREQSRDLPRDTTMARLRDEIVAAEATVRAHLSVDLDDWCEAARIYGAANRPVPFDLDQRRRDLQVHEFDDFETHVRFPARILTVVEQEVVDALLHGRGWAGAHAAARDRTVRALAGARSQAGKALAPGRPLEVYLDEALAIVDAYVDLWRQRASEDAMEGDTDLWVTAALVSRSHDMYDPGSRTYRRLLAPAQAVESDVGSWMLTFVPKVVAHALHTYGRPKLTGAKPIASAISKAQPGDTPETFEVFWQILSAATGGVTFDDALTAARGISYHVPV